MNNSERLAAIYTSGNTRRWHAEDIIGEQRVSSHTWGMTAIVLILHPDPSADLLRAITFHDAPEVFSGDIPFFARKAHEGLAAGDREIGDRWFDAMLPGGDPRTLTDEEKWWLSFADAAEAYFFVQHQVALGNQYMGQGPYWELGERLGVLRAQADEQSVYGGVEAVDAVATTRINRRITRDIRAFEKGNI